MNNSIGLKKIVCLLEILGHLTTSQKTEALASISYKNSYDTRDNHKIDEVFLYLNKNFMRDISMPEVAGLCHMTPQSFCRFFKNRTKSTFVDFLNDIRISHARKLLIESDEQTIAEIAYLCGYKNLSNFNKLFKIKTKLTPKEYKRNLQANWVIQ
jgi:AraC-like DNA-binding protein